MFLKGHKMTNTKKTTDGFKAQIIHNLDAHENHMVSADNCASIVAENMAKAYDQKVVGLPKLNDAKQINDACIDFVALALELDFKQLSGNKKSCLRKAIVVAVGLVKSGALSEVKGKSLSDNNKLWVDGDYLKSHKNLKHLNKEGATQVALGFAQLTSMAKEVLNMKASRTTSTEFELCIQNFNKGLDKKLDSADEKSGFINCSDNESKQLTNTFNKIKKLKEMLNAQKDVRPKDGEAKINFA